MFQIWPKNLLPLATPLVFSEEKTSDTLNTAFVEAVMEMTDDDWPAFLSEDNGKVLSD
jgi:hypothetical protein